VTLKWVQTVKRPQETYGEEFVMGKYTLVGWNVHGTFRHINQILSRMLSASVYQQQVWDLEKFLPK
jgi:hypothetical protein